MADIVRRTGGGGQVPSLRSEFEPIRWMESLLRWDPFRTMSPFQGSTEEGVYFVPRFDVKETKDTYLFKADLPGMKESDLEITMSGNQLVVSGKRESEEKEQGETYYTIERSYGNFVRSFTLPDGCDADRVQADMKDGVLTLRVPKKPELQAKRIAIKADTGGGAGGGAGGGKEKAKA